MKYLRHKMPLCAAMALMLAACTSEDDINTPAQPEGEVIYPSFSFSVSEMEMTAVTRAISPMSPDIEKYVTTIALFEFDNEGLHINSPSTYHFIDFVEGTVDGVKNVGQITETKFGVVESSLEGLALESRSKGTICLVANVTKEEVRQFYESSLEGDQTYGRLTFDKFKEWKLELLYQTVPGAAYDETVAGHIKTMYMFGYYQGPISKDNPKAICVDLGRLASRLDISVINETGKEIDKRLGYHFDEVCKFAYFFPIKMDRPPTYGTGQTRTVVCSGSDELMTGVQEKFAANATHTRYFYCAAHSATGIEEATKLHLYYGAPMIEDTDLPGPGGSDFEIPLCNIHPSQAGEVKNGYSLSRNTRYHFTIRLKSSESTSQTAPVSRATAPGEFTVYLP